MDDNGMDSGNSGGGLSVGGGWSTGLSNTGLGPGVSDTGGNLGLKGPSGGYFGGGGDYSGGGGLGLQGSTQDLFSYDPVFTGGYSPSTSYSLGDVYSQDSGQGMTFNGSYGLQMPSSSATTNLGLGGEQEADEDFWNTGWVKFVKGLGKFALSTNPIGRAGLTAYGMYNAAQNKDYGALAQGLVGTATGNGLLGAAAGIGTNAAMGKDVGSQVGSTLGSVVGGGIAGPLGAYAGSRLGAAAGSAGYTGERGYTDRTMGGSGGSRGFGATDALGTLAGLYSANKAQSAAKANTLDLSSMYGPNSAYAQQLRQQLERRDAASGRRSQYGPREVELQAQLAKMMASAAPSIMKQNLAAQQQATANRNNQLNLLLKAGKDTGAFDYLERGLSNLFSSNNSQPLYFDNNTQGTVYSV